MIRSHFSPSFVPYWIAAALAGVALLTLLVWRVEVHWIVLAGAAAGLLRLLAQG